MPVENKLYCIGFLTFFAILVIIGAEVDEENTDSEIESLEKRSALPGRRRLRGRVGSSGSGRRPELSDLTRLQQRRWTSEEMMAFAPGTPSPDQVQCHVELQITRVVGGRCVRLGTFGQRACQSGRYLDIFNTVCNSREFTAEDTIIDVQGLPSATTTPLPPQ
ncbi:hypothetical protein ScPMuIL_003905 [Solemya velum]